MADRAVNTRTLDRLFSTHATVALLVIHDDVYAPIFDRLESEIATEETKLIVNDPVACARAIVAARKAVRPL
ncbi:hypothetical protein N7E70_017475 [Aminobacter sp. NyZ550]|uniref:Uncharacterized protein n=1 Tax=Aminobacter carboxidus TaxID=376165 RepID=A0ABR9GJX4_9HYPH|nr:MULTISPECIES: hypothetical protein [Aminobacter]MBE1203975.1 hypothetical protein [Aminobacter carboxidus]WAX93472.1 hypothetical protein N7E70_017475 [Aminobacter sp. NyZ550]